LGRVIGGGVVHDEDLVGAADLFEHVLDCPHDEASAVVGGNDDADAGHGAAPLPAMDRRYSNIRQKGAARGPLHAVLSRTPGLTRTANQPIITYVTQDTATGRTRTPVEPTSRAAGCRPPAQERAA